MTTVRSTARLLVALALASTCLVLGAGVDIARATTFTVTKTADTADGTCNADCSLREAVIAANTHAGADIIVVPAGTYVLTISGADEDAAATGDLDILEAVAIEGAGADTTAIDGNGLDRVVHIRDGAVSLTDLTIKGGKIADAGGGIVVESGSLLLTSCAVEGNEGVYGGGIASMGHLTLTASTVSGNKADMGAGILIMAATADLTNSTASGNTATTSGGGILVDADVSTAALNLTNFTFSGNTAGVRAGEIYNRSSAVTLANVLFVGNCETDGGTFTSSGGNLESPGNTCGLTHVSDQVSVVDPKLGPLASNGGPTQTIALLAGSPAIDNGLGASCPATDQRGVSRPQGAACDVGAFESCSGLWCGSGDLDGGWRWFNWLGFFNVNSDPWIYHQQLDWMYVSGTTTSDLWIYYPKMAAWLWTSNTTFPWLYRTTGLSPSWLYYLEWTTGPAWFHNQTTDQWEAF